LALARVFIVHVIVFLNPVLSVRPHSDATVSVPPTLPTLDTDAPTLIHFVCFTFSYTFP
jgi:hypothetical protein